MKKTAIIASLLLAIVLLIGLPTASVAADDGTITVTGSIKNYQGTIEFDAGCKLDAVK